MSKLALICFAAIGSCLHGCSRLPPVPIAQPQCSLEGHCDGVTAVAWLSDGSLASAGYDGLILVWDTAECKPTIGLRAHDKAISSLAASPSGTVLATGSNDTSVCVWSVTDRRKLATLSGHADIVSAVAFSPDGSRLASCSWDGKVVIWDLATYTELQSFTRPSVATTVAFSPDNGVVAVGSGELYQGYVELWDCRLKCILQRFSGFSGQVESVAFAPDGLRLFAGGTDKLINELDIASGSVVGTYSGHQNTIHQLSVSADGQLLASAGRDSTTRVWDVAGKREIAKLTGHHSLVLSVSFSPDGRKLASASYDKSIKIRDVSRLSEALTKPMRPIDTRR